MTNRTFHIHFFSRFLLLFLISHIDARAVAGQINAGVFGPVEDFIQILSRDGNHLYSVTLSEGTGCIHVFAQGKRHTTHGCITHSLLNSLIIHLQGVPVSHPIDLTQFPGAICVLFAMSFSLLNPVLLNQHTMVTGAHASENNAYLVLTLNSNNHNSTANSTRLTLIPVASEKGPPMIKVLIRIGDGSQIEFFVQFGSKARGGTLPRRKKSFPGNNGGARPDDSGGTVFSRIKRSLSLKRSGSSASTTGYRHKAQGTNYFAPFILRYTTDTLLSIIYLLFPEFLL